MASTIETLSPTETATMLKHRWWVASNGKDTFPFTTEAVERIFTYSKGIPRTQVILAQNALLGAFLLGLKSIDAEIIDEVVKDRGLPDTEPEPEPQTIDRHLKRKVGEGKKK